jgi:hypothetical protein
MTFEIASGHEREPFPPARVKDHRFIVNDEVLAQVEPASHGVDPQRSVDPVDARCNLVNSSAGMGIREHDVSPEQVSGQWSATTTS